MLDASYGLAVAVDLAIFLGAGYLAATLSARVRGSRLSFPLLMLFGGVCVYAATDAAAAVAGASDAPQLASEFARASVMGIGISVPAFVSFVAVYPRNIRTPWVTTAATALYIVGIALAVLAPTHLLIENSWAYAAGGGMGYGPAYVALIAVLTGGLLVSLGWTLYLALRGTPGFERETAARLSVALGVPLILGLALAAAGMNRVGPIGNITISFGLWIAAIAWIVQTGGLRPPVHSTFSGLLNSVADPVFIVDRETRVVAFNREAERLVGSSARDASYRLLRDLLVEVLRGPGAPDMVETAIRAVIHGRMESQEGLLEGVGDGKRVFRFRIVPIAPRGAREEADAALLTLHDETKRRAEERETARSRDVLDLVIRMLGHDLKAPLTVAMGYIELDKARLGNAKGPDGTGAAVRADLEKISEVLVSMQVLMGNARALSRLAAVGDDVPRASEVDLSRMVRQAVELLKPVAAARQLTIESTVADKVEAPVVPGFDSVPRNLLDNAIKYAPPGGTVAVVLSVQGEAIVLTVTDTGPGIPPEKLDHLFRKFERLGAEAGPQEGQGLGLSIVSKLVELSRGKVTAGDREDGKSGAMFKVELPLPKKKKA